MEQPTLIRRSAKGLQVKIVAIGIVAFLSALLASWLLTKLFAMSSSDGLFTKLLVWLLFIGAWALGAAKLWFNWQVKRYEIGKDALIVHSKAGKFGKSQAIYRYESIISMRMTQGLLGKRFGYGDVLLSIPKLDKEVVMSDIDHPAEQLAEVQQRLAERSISHDALVN